jgi:nucleoside-triphosphate--adenylate kinase
MRKSSLWVASSHPMALYCYLCFYVNVCIRYQIFSSLFVVFVCRWIHPGSGRTYSYSYHPPKLFGHDDETGEPLVQRDDDKPESVRKRLEAYDQVTQPLVHWYDEKGALQVFHGTESDIIYPQVKEFLESKFL